MINFIEGRLNIGEKNILAACDNDLKALAEEGLIEKRKTGRDETYYYVEAEADCMRFGVFISKSTPFNTHECQFLVIFNHQVAGSSPAAGTKIFAKNQRVTWGFT